MNDSDENDKITGKQLLLEFEELLQNLGEYLYRVGKTVCVKIKVALADKDKDKHACAESDDKPDGATT